MKASSQPTPGRQAAGSELLLSPSILEHLPDGFALCRRCQDDLTIDYANSAFARLLGQAGWSAPDSLNRLLEERLDAASRASLRAGLRNQEGISILLTGPADLPGGRLRLALEPLDDGVGWIGSLVPRYEDQRDSDRVDGPALDRRHDAPGEPALLAVRSQLNDIASSVPGVVYQIRYACDLSRSRFLFVSEGAQQLLGLSPQALLADAALFTERIFAQDQPQLTAGLRQAVAGREPWRAEFRILDRAGDVKWVQARAAPSGPNSDEQVVYSGILTDVTQARRAAQRLAVAELRLQELSAALPGLVFQIEVRPEGGAHLAFISDGVKDICGVDPAQADLTTLQEMVLPEDRPALAEHLKRASEHMEVTSFERRIRDRRGNLRWLQTRSRPVRGADGMLSWVGITLDVTSEKQTQIALEAAHQRLNEVTRFMPGAVFQAELTPDGGRCTYISEGGSELLGLDHDTITGNYPAVRRLVHADDRDELQAALIRAISRMERLDHEFRIIDTQGRQRWLRVACKPRPGQAGTTLVEGQASDITQQKEIARALSDARSELRQLSRTMPGAIYQVAYGPDFQARYVYMSESWSELFGFDAALAKRDPHAFVAILNAEDRARNRSRMERAVRNFQPYEIEFRARTPAGVRWIRSAARPVRREGDQTIYSAVAVDVTELKDAATALEVSQQQLSDLTATLPGAVFQVVVSAAGHAELTFLSEGIQDIYGVAAADLLGPAEKALALVPGRQAGELRDRLVAMARKGVPLELERLIATAKGEHRWLRFTARPVTGDDGDIRYHGMITDITRLKRTEARLADSEQRLELALENGKLGLLDWDIPSGRIVFNRQFARIIGTPEEQLGDRVQDLAEFEVPADRPRINQARQAHFEGRTSEYSCKYRISRGDGAERWVHALGRVVQRDTDEHPVRYVGTLQDITDRVRAERQLEQQVVFSRLITRLSSQFVNLGVAEVDRAVDEALALIGGFGDVDFAYLCELRAGEILERTATWGARAATQEDSPVPLRWTQSDWLRKQVLGQQLVYLPDVGALPPSASEEREALAAVGARSLVAVPLHIGGKVLGALVLQSNGRGKHWSPGNLSLLRIVAEIISQALDRQRSELALVAAETTVREITRALPGIVYQLYRDPTGRLDWRFMSGTLLDQVAGKDPNAKPTSFLDLVDPRDLQELHSALSASAAAQSHLEQDVRLGSRMRWARISAYPHQVPDGGTIFNGIAIDITDTKLAEAALQASEERFRELYNTTPVMMHGVDGSGRIISINEHWLTTLGYGREEVVGRRAEEFMPAASRARLRSELGQLVSKGSLREVVLQMLAKSGRTIDVILAANAVLDENDNILGVKSSMVDVTERNRALRALEESEVRYRAVVQDQTEIICRFDPDGAIDFVNDACLRFLDRPADEVIGSNWFHLLSQPAAESLRAELRQLVPGAPVSHREASHVDPRGEPLWCQWTLRAFFDRRDQLVGFQAVGRDVTEVKQLEREIRRISQREQERIGHDLHDGLGQELTGLSLMLKTLEREVEATASDLLPEIRVLAETLNHSIASARALAQGLSPIELDREGLIGALEHLVDHSGKMYGLPIVLTAPRRVRLADVAVATDLYRIAQEAIANAARHAGAGVISVALSDTDGALILDICDDGSGIKANQSSSDGMGLRIMRYRANIIGATLDIAPRAEGGTRVRCILRHAAAEERLKTA